MKTQIIAELGAIAEGSLSTMLRQIDACAAAGVDAVKAQWLSDPAALVTRRKAHAYAGGYGFLAYPVEWLAQLHQHAHDQQLAFGCSVFLPGDAAKVALFVDFLKVASFEAGTNLKQEALDAGRHVIVSAGMMSHEELIALVAWREEQRQFCSLVDVLHCVSDYGGWIPYAQRNLGVIRHYDLDGFSDHARDVTSGHDAVLAGARILEVHTRLGDSDPANPDYGVALDPIRLAYYVVGAREAEAILGDGLKRLQPCEVEMAKFRAEAA